MPAARDEEIPALRGEFTSSELATGPFDHWICSGCGYGWVREEPPPDEDPSWVLEEANPKLPRRPRRWWTILIPVFLVAALTAAAFRFGPLAHRSDGGGSAPPPSASAEAPAPVRHIRAVLTLTQPTWVRAVADGKVLERSTLQPGHAVVLRAKKVLRLVIGNGAAVQLRVNGERVKTGNDATLLRLTLVRTHGDIRTRTA